MNGNNSTQGNETFAWSWTHPISDQTRIAMCSVLFVWSLVANVLVIAVVYYNQNLRTNMNYLIVNMAVSDLLVPLVTMPWLISDYATNGQWLVGGPLGEALCKLVYFLSHISPVVSSISLFIIALQRFIAVVYPHRGQILSRKTRWIANSFPWIVAMSLKSPYLYVARVIVGSDTICIEEWSQAFDDETALLIFFSIAYVVGFVVPLIMIIILYTMIIYKLRRTLENVRNMMAKESIRSRQKRNKNFFSMLITIVVLFTICWCPLVVLVITILAPNSHVLSMDRDNLISLLYAFWYMWFLLAAINPCIYFVFLKDFRQGLKSFCCTKPSSAIEPIRRRPQHQVEIVTRTQHVHHLASIPLSLGKGIVKKSNLT